VFGMVVLATLLIAAPAAHAACRSPKNICRHFDDCLQRTSDPNNKDTDGIRWDWLEKSIATGTHNSGPLERLRYFSLRSCCCRLRHLLRFPSRDFLGFSDFGRVGPARDLKKLWQIDLRPKIET
jgi:hypothetical protein